MPSWPDVTIMVITYNRRDVLHGTLTRLYEHLAYSGKLHYIVADDGSNDGTQQMLASDHPDVHLVQSLRLGLGGNTNAGLRAAFELSDLVGSLQDDMHLLCPHSIWISMSRSSRRMCQPALFGCGAWPATSTSPAWTSSTGASPGPARSCTSRATGHTSSIAGSGRPMDHIRILLTGGTGTLGHAIHRPGAPARAGTRASPSTAARS
jgi:hypothetical protein